MLKTGARLRSQVCETEVVVVRAGDAETALHCGGHPMVDLTASPSEQRALDPRFASGSALGKRYTDEAHTVEVLVTHAGEGSLALGDVALERKGANPLPSSD
ncbi:hypothetical protein [Streptomyces sulphureus]|uniref:hypothetical protein n=1 Tax=Streptomyces sulphureus TaxID=47758 RepID=UPI00036613A5|nr:hypothetical protein [Streptomyces sulphureus]